MMGSYTVFRKENGVPVLSTTNNAYANGKAHPEDNQNCKGEQH